MRAPPEAIVCVCVFVCVHLKRLDHNSSVEENLRLGHNDDVLVFKKNLQFTRVRAQRHELRQRLEINRAVFIRVCRNHLQYAYASQSLSLSLSLSVCVCVCACVCVCVYMQQPSPQG